MIDGSEIQIRKDWVPLSHQMEVMKKYLSLCHYLKVQRHFLDAMLNIPHSLPPVATLLLQTLLDPVGRHINSPQFQNKSEGRTTEPFTREIGFPTLKGNNTGRKREEATFQTTAKFTKR